MAETAAAIDKKRIRGRSLKGEVLVTRRAYFNAAHRLDNPDKSEDWNREMYGCCNSAHWHGHNYWVEVSVAGEPDPETGYVIDLAYLKKVINEAIVEKCDHKNLNLDVDFLEGIIPSTENLAVAFWHQIKPYINQGRLHSVRVRETDCNSVEFRG